VSFSDPFGLRAEELDTLHVVGFGAEDEKNLAAAREANPELNARLTELENSANHYVIFNSDAVKGCETLDPRCAFPAQSFARGILLHLCRRA